MKKLYILTFFSLLALSLGAQDQGTTVSSNSGATSSQGAKDTHDLYPLSMYDPRLRLKSVSFVKRHADTGRGEFLDVLVEVESRVMENHDYAIYVLAGFEKNDINEAERRTVPYPLWRKYDPHKESLSMYFSNVMPTPVTSKEIWGEEKYKKKIEEIEKLHWEGFESEIPEPTFGEIVDYLCKNQTKALPFTLFGEAGPTTDKIVVHNYIAQTPEEKKKQVHETLPKHTYTIYNNKYKASITSHHYSQYRPNFLSFNKVAVLIFDTKKPVNSLLFRRFYDIRDIKMSN